MGNIFRRKRAEWIPPNLKLLESLEMGRAQKWEQELSMRGWKICKDGAELADVLRVNATVSVLDLSYNGLGDYEADMIGEALKENRTLTRLNLANNHIHADGAAALAEAFIPEGGDMSKVNRKLAFLNLSNNAIGDVGAESIAKIISSNESLVEVNLFWNGMTTKGIYEILQSARGSKLAKLDLRYNSMADDPEDKFLMGEIHEAIAGFDGELLIDYKYK